jgi:hypothetical protein
VPMITDGAAHAAATALEGGPQRLARAARVTQVAALIVGGAAIAWMDGAPALRARAATSWFVLAAPFLGGLWLYAFEVLDRPLVKARGARRGVGLQNEAPADCEPLTGLPQLAVGSDTQLSGHWQ